MTRMIDDPNRHTPFCPKSAARARLPGEAALDEHIRRTRQAVRDRLGSDTAAAVRLRAIEKLARDTLPADQAAATLCCAPGVAWLETRLDAAGDATGRAAFEAELEALMDEPAFWRDQDPATVRRIWDGFARLKGE